MLIFLETDDLIMFPYSHWLIVEVILLRGNVSKLLCDALKTEGPVAKT